MLGSSDLNTLKAIDPMFKFTSYISSDMITFFSFINNILFCSSFSRSLILINKIKEKKRKASHRPPQHFCVKKWSLVMGIAHLTIPSSSRQNGKAGKTHKFILYTNHSHGCSAHLLESELIFLHKS